MSGGVHVCARLGLWARSSAVARTALAQLSCKGVQSTAAQHCARGEWKGGPPALGYEHACVLTSVAPDV